MRLGALISRSRPGGIPERCRSATMRTIALSLTMSTVLGTSTALGDDRVSCVSAVLTLAETAELLRVDSDVLDGLAARHAIPARRVASSWRFSCAAVMRWLEGDWQPVSNLAAIRGAGIASGQAPEPESAPGGRAVTVSEDEPIGEAPGERSAEDVLLRDQQILVNRGNVTYNFGQFLSSTDNQALLTADGNTVLASADQDALFTTFQARIGVGVATELFTGASYSVVDTDVLVDGRKLASSRRRELGGVSFGVRHTLMREGPGRPGIIATFRGLVPTAQSSQAVGGGLAFIRSIDPVALFASINYTRTFSEEFADIARLEPKRRLDASLGFALALNDKLSLSSSVSASFTGTTRFPGATLRHQDAYGLGFGLTTRVARGIYLEPNVSLGLGGPRDSFTLGVSVFTFTP